MERFTLTSNTNENRLNIMASVGNMQDAALKRKERLRALQEKKQTPESEKTNENAENADSTETESLPRPVFRSYKPQDDTLKESSITQAKPADVSEKIKSQLEETQIKEVISEVDLINLAPRKPDWDLKRDVAKKLEKLERRTQRAIAELIRERLKESNEDFALVVNASEAERGKV